MRYILTEVKQPPQHKVCQDRLPKFTMGPRKKYNNQNHTRLKHNKGLDHQLWQFKTRVTLVVFNHL
ncbi:unnamed protein product [Trifolium pratense]|uniref:Uncharacterized protein n=1 Tax=Trifolium pratense TaxID=57577 RepID=A0ACB0ID51_TRIPR|nr:unnamed protein product [Trifolium pratense]